MPESRTELEGGGEQPLRHAEVHVSRSERVRQRLNTRPVLIGIGAVTLFLVSVMLVLYFKPGSTAEPSGEPSLDMFAAGPLADFEPGFVTLFENEHFFLVRLDDVRLLALYDMPPSTQAQVLAGDVAALDCRAILREDADMAGWLRASDVPSRFGDRGIWHECSGAAWDVEGNQVWGPEGGRLDTFPIFVIDGIIRVDLASRRCSNPVTEQAPCIETQ